MSIPIIRCTKVFARDLAPGDLFSVRGSEYWSSFASFISAGEAVYIRTATPADDFPDPDSEVYRIMIEHYPLHTNNSNHQIARASELYHCHNCKAPHLRLRGAQGNILAELTISPDWLLRFLDDLNRICEERTGKPEPTINA